MSFQVGDVVEVVSVIDPRNSAWVGRQVMVVEVGVQGWNAFDKTNFVGIKTSPRTKLAGLWYSYQLRKINPPDWSAPIETEREVSV